MISERVRLGEGLREDTLARLLLATIYLAGECGSAELEDGLFRLYATWTLRRAVRQS